VAQFSCDPASVHGPAHWKRVEFHGLLIAPTNSAIVEVIRLFAALPQLMAPSAVLTVYGPFNYDGAFTSPSNAAFDASLRADQPQRGIRDFEAVDALAQAAGLALIDDHAMPANNRCITWQRRP